MSITQLLGAVKDFVVRERKLASGKTSAADLRSAREELNIAATDLELQIEGYVEERSRPGNIRSILVAVDGSEQAEWALDEAVRLAEGLDARVSLVYVLVTPSGLAPDLAPDFSSDAAAGSGRSLLRALATRVPPHHVGEQIFAAGAADRVIVAVAEQSRSDLIVIGTHGRGLVGRVLLGSVAAAVIRHAPCPVLTVGHPRQGTAPEPYGIGRTSEIASIDQEA